MFVNKKSPASVGKNSTSTTPNSNSKKNIKPNAPWNNYLTEENYKISSDEVLKRKQLYISKNNILFDINNNINTNNKEKKNNSSKLNSVRKNNTKPSKNSVSVLGHNEDESVISNLEAYDQHIAYDAVE